MEEQGPEAVSATTESTGVPAVDEVLERVSRLGERPVSEHVEVFERAHEQLRRALDAQPDAGPHPVQGT